MALNSLGLGFVFTARDLASGTITGLTRSFTGLDAATLRASASFQRNLGVLGVGITALAAGAVGIGSAIRSASAAGELDRTLTAVGLKARASADQVQMLHDETIRLSDVGFAPQMVAEAMDAIVSQGFNAAQTIDMLSPSLQLAQAGQIGMTQATESLISALHVFGLSAGQAGDAVDQMLKAADLTALQPRDLELALGTVGRGASIANQSLSEMLISMGLVRNTGVDASVAAQSVSSALIFMASRAEKFRNLGVEITDANGRFRNFIDIVSETNQVLARDFPDAADRTAQATELFSRFGLSAYSAISTQLSTGVQDATGHILRGADAVNYLREQMNLAATTDYGAIFQQRIMDTYAGQIQMIESNVEGLRVVLGEAFTPVLRPIATQIVVIIRTIKNAINDMSPEMRAFLGRVALIAMAVATFGGALLAAGAAVAILGPFLTAAVSAAMGLLVAMLPIVAVMGLVGAAAYMMFRAGEENVGGFGDRMRKLWHDVQLAAGGIAQIFQQGFIKGPVAEELATAGNEGVLSFVERFHSMFVRVQEFAHGFIDGFNAVTTRIGPTLDRLWAAFERLGGAMGLDAGPLTTPLERVAVVGARVGYAIATVAEWIIRAGAAMTEMGAGVMTGFSAGLEATGFELQGLIDAFVQVAEALGMTVDATVSGRSNWELFGRAVGGVVGFVAGGLGWMLQISMLVISRLGQAVDWLVNTFIIAGEAIGWVLRTVVENLYALIEGAIGAIARLAGMLGVDGADELANTAFGNIQARADSRELLGEDVARRFRRDRNMFNPFADESVRPSVAESRARAENDERRFQSMTSAMRGTEGRRERPIQLTAVVQMDSREVGRTALMSHADDAEESFMSVAPPMSFSPGS